jgi:transcriptional regulator with XRE-family HTH domain
MMLAGELREARRILGLTVREFADMLGVRPQHVRRMETPPGQGAHRRVTATTERLVRAYLSGYRPRDWPRASG